MAVNQSEKPFVWQGMLIVLPALILAAAGGHLLWENRRWAEQEAEQRARELANGVLAGVSNRISAISVPELDASSGDSEMRLERAPLLRFSQENRGCVAFRVERFARDPGADCVDAPDGGGASRHLCG